ncbi:MAG TPA: protein-glutamate O-methyltransferase CheR [Polyangiaceae bacterium]|nr:protein-glutamate O-methyltransferase CheR [Polyangiaceae bacterium]
MPRPDSMAYLQGLVYRRSGIVLEDGKDYLVDSRLSPVARCEGVESVDELVDKLRRDRGGELAQRVVEAMTTNETLFFRDAHPFDALRNHFVPELLKARSQERSLRIWSAAAATGQEPYSIAMALLEAFPELASWRVSILATDLNEAVLERARRGRYRALEVSRGLPPSYLSKYFSRVDGDWELSANVRDMVTFRQLNLVEPWFEIAPCDLVFMRNVLIYFDANTKTTVLKRLHSVLRPDGFLVLGGAETTTNLDDSYASVRVGPGVYYQLKTPSPAESTRGAPRAGDVVSSRTPRVA